MEQEANDISKIAKLAKERLKNNSYANLTNIVSIKQRSNTFTSAINIHKTENPALPQTIISKDELLYKRVCELMLDSQVINPVGELIDRKVFNGLDVEAKQRYINTLNTKFKELKARYYKEHIMTLVSV